jgi:hypothetical protein
MTTAAIAYRRKYRAGPTENARSAVFTALITSSRSEQVPWGWCAFAGIGFGFPQFHPFLLGLPNPIL